ncbi:MAG: methyltransferase domain-containing protein [Candidatus Krumholzibacteria bacterium]|nr:methyltransferase domain-containing protein [Candidatus Krumholzibacteria bacterium]
MPFRPLPTTFTDQLSKLNPETDTVLELGSGEGHFKALVEAQGLHCLGLDLRHPVGGVVSDVVGDARRAPIRPGSLKILVAANLVRHIAPRQRLGEFVLAWRRLLKPDGQLFIFEDEPSQAPPAERNFRDLQAFLAQMMPESRGPLMSLERFRQTVGAEAKREGWNFGFQRNEETLNATEVMRFLSAGAGAQVGAVAKLVRAIGRDGLDPGQFWWAQVGAAEIED